LNKYILNHNK